MRKLMKPKFAYLYLSFIVSLAIVVFLSFLFYKKLNSNLKYTRQSNESYGTIIQLRQLEEKMMELENYTRGYLLIGDTSFLPLYNASRDSVQAHIENLRERLKGENDQERRFLLMRATINGQLNLYNGTIGRLKMEDSTSMKTAVRRGKTLMTEFRNEAARIEQAERKKMNDANASKEFFEDYYPNYFNTISIWAGIITLVSFFFINKEVRIRARYQSELERKLQELNRSNSELKQFAYIASHDLQEPLRKIRTFSDKLVYKHQDELDTETGIVIARIEASARRMQELIQDMLNFTGLVSREDRMTDVDLNPVITDVLKEYIEITKTRHAIITWDKMPVIKGNTQQLTLLFKSLFDNAFKFAKPGVPPEIKLTCNIVDGNNEDDAHLRGKQYYKIQMEDKGIGFNNEFAEKIFMIFQRLHTQQSGYRGKGIGLAIAQRIMTNHNGVIMARGMINDGATFIMYFPL